MQENTHELLTTGAGILIGLFAYVGIRAYFNRKKEEKELLKKMEQAKMKTLGNVPTGAGKGRSPSTQRRQI